MCLYILFVGSSFGLVGAVVSIMHCGCIDPGSIPGLDSMSAPPIPQEVCEVHFVIFA